MKNECGMYKCKGIEQDLPLLDFYSIANYGHYMISDYLYSFPFQNKAKTLKQWPRGQGNNKSINEETVIATSSTKNGTVATAGTSK